MKKLLCFVLMCALCLPVLFSAAAEAFVLPALGVSITPESGQTLTIHEADDAAEAENAPYAALADGEGNRMDIWVIENESWQALDFSQATADELLAIADAVIYSADAPRPTDAPSPDVTVLGMIGEFNFLGFTHENEAGEKEDSLFAVLPSACLYCTFAREDGELIDADASNALLDALYSLAPAEGGEAAQPETEAPVEAEVEAEAGESSPEPAAEEAEDAA